MSQPNEGRGKADWSAPPRDFRGGLVAEPEGRRAGPASDPTPPPPEPDSLAAAREWLQSAPRRLVGLQRMQLIDAVARTERAYDEFPELEFAMPRGGLVEALRLAVDGVTDDAAIPLLMAGVLLDGAPSSSCLAVLLHRMAGAGHGDVIAPIIAILAQRRSFGGEEIAPVLDELCRQQRNTAALAAISQVLGHLGADPDAALSQLGLALSRLLPDAGSGDGDPSALAKVVLSARNRVQPAIRPQATAAQGAALLTLAERVAAKLPQRSPLPSRTASTARRAGAAAVPALAVPSPQIGGAEVEWLPLMQVGRAGERSKAEICARPGQTGHLVYGPYARLAAGDYRVRMCWTAGRPVRSAPRDQPIATIEAVSRYGKSYLAQRELRLEDCTRPEHDLLFHVGGRPTAPAPAIEVRVWTSGIVPLTVSSISVALVAPLSARLRR